MQTFDYFSFLSDILRIMITDSIMLGALLLFFFNGWRKGFLKTLLGPITLIIGCLIAYYHYQQTQNIAVSISICVFSPFALKILASMMLNLWNKAVNNAAPLSTASKVLGSIVGVLWSGSYLALLLVMIGFLILRITALVFYLTWILILSKHP